METSAQIDNSDPVLNNGWILAYKLFLTLNTSLYSAKKWPTVALYQLVKLVCEQNSWGLIPTCIDLLCNRCYYVITVILFCLCEIIT